MELLTTEDVLAQTGLPRHVFKHLRRKFERALQPVKKIGPTMMWDPGVIPLVQGLRKHIKPMGPRSKERELAEQREKEMAR